MSLKAFLTVVLVLFQTVIKVDCMKVQIEDCNFGPYDESWISNLQVYCGPLNQTVKGETISITLKKDLRDSANVAVQFFVRFGNRYKLSPLKLQLSLREVLALKSFDLPNLFLNYSKPPLVYPLRKGKYSVTNYVTDGSKYPQLPSGYYKLRMEFKDVRKVVLTFNHFISVEN